MPNTRKEMPIALSDRARAAFESDFPDVADMPQDRRGRVKITASMLLTIYKSGFVQGRSSISNEEWTSREQIIQRACARLTDSKRKGNLKF